MAEPERASHRAQMAGSLLAALLIVAVTIALVTARLGPNAEDAADAQADTADAQADAAEEAADDQADAAEEAAEQQGGGRRGAGRGRRARMTALEVLRPEPAVGSGRYRPPPTSRSAPVT